MNMIYVHVVGSAKKGHFLAHLSSSLLLASLLVEGSKSFLAAPLLCLLLPLRLRLDSHDLEPPPAEAEAEVIEEVIEERLLRLFEPGLALERWTGGRVTIK